MTFTIDFSTVAGWLIAAAPVYMPILIFLLTTLYQQWLSKLPANQRPVVQGAVSTAVAAVEQTASDVLNGPGKKQLAIEAVQSELAHWNIKVPQTVISAMIEEAVAAMNAVPAPAPAVAVESTKSPIIVAPTAPAQGKVDMSG